MKQLPITRWQRFLEASRFLAKQQHLNVQRLETKADSLATEFAASGCLKLLLKELLKIPDYCWARFFTKLLEPYSAQAAVPSPVSSESDQRWLTTHATCFVNVRATGLSAAKPGSFISALKVLPALRARNLHIAPFFECVFENLYALNSIQTPTPDVIDQRYCQLGLEPNAQIALLIDAAHLLGKTVGFDLEPHTGQFSWVVLSYPRCFRWLRLAESRTSLYGDMPQATMLQEDVQQQLAEEVAAIVKRIVSEHGYQENEDSHASALELRALQNQLYETLAGAGYWTLPSHTWGGAGLPAFQGYNREKGYPLFTYLSMTGEDHAKHAFGMLTPFKFYSGLPINRVPDQDHPPQRVPEAIDLFTGIFDRIQTQFDFDFVRVDYVDHVFDSVAQDNQDFPLSDRVTPPILRETIARVRQRLPYIGAMAERMGHDIDVYSKVGFNLVLGTEVLGNYNQNSLAWTMEVSRRIATLQQPGFSGSVQLALDTHDSGHPLFWQQPLAQVIGPQGMSLRHFISRFATAGLGFRPKYECLGNQDLSYGLYKANNKAVSLTWSADREYLKRYHWIEDLFALFSRQILKGRVAGFTAHETHAWWNIELSSRERLICLVYLERSYPDIKSQLADAAPYPDLHHLSIPAGTGLRGKRFSIQEFRFPEQDAAPIAVSAEAAIHVARLLHNEFKLFYVTGED